MMKHFLLLLLLLPCRLHAQSSTISLPPGTTRFLRDTLTQKQLLQSLDGFLSQKEEINSKNTYVWQPELTATSLLLDEMKGIERNAATKENHYYKAYLTNITPMKDSLYLVQFSYLAQDSAGPRHKASFRLLARRARAEFAFYSPLKRNCSGWKTKSEGKITFYYRDSINAKKTKEYRDYHQFYLKKLKLPLEPVAIYYCNDFQDALQLSGVDYKADYAGRSRGALSAAEDHRYISVNGNMATGSKYFDPHDMWHDKLRLALPGVATNKAVDEGCAFLYGGSWGLSWGEIKALFKAYHKQHPQSDWLQLYINGTDFKEGNEPLKVSYFLNALVVQDMEHEQGFDAVLQLLQCGKNEQGDANYFSMLEKLNGISKENFNAHIDQLLHEM
jgi:hypothetical protein